MKKRPFVYGVNVVIKGETTQIVSTGFVAAITFRADRILTVACTAHYFDVLGLRVNGAAPDDSWNGPVPATAMSEAVPPFTVRSLVRRGQEFGLEVRNIDFSWHVFRGCIIGECLTEE